MSDKRQPSPREWHRIEAIWGDALELPPEERKVHLDRSCGGDPELRHEVESLLAPHGYAADFLETSAADLTARLLADDGEEDLAGRQIGPYVVGAWIGSGGMGDVYRARDTRLNRDVALKFLPRLYADDPERMARFTSEAQVLAALNHPNIGAVYGYEEADGLRAIVLELVEGTTLADVMARGPLPLEDALPVARQMAEGLEAAHDCGVIHRDLKPSNVALRADGQLKLLDFGLATMLTGATATMAASLGTPAYASPEQIRMRPTDRRSDIWAFGAIVYEMLSGKRAFPGDSTAEIVESVQRHAIDWRALPESTPLPIRQLLARCLERDNRQRLRDIGEARIALDQRALVDSERHSPLAAGRRTPTAWIRATAVAASVAVIAAWFALRPPVAPSLATTRFAHVLPEGQSIALPAVRRAVALSPDGQQLVYAVSAGLRMRPLASLEAEPIRGTEAHGSVTNPVFSPDGQAIAFWSPTAKAIKRIPAGGGEAVTIVAADDPFGMSWRGNSILYGQGAGGIMRVRDSGGTPEQVVRLADDQQAYGPDLLPDGDHVLFTVAASTGDRRWDQAMLVVQSLSSGERKVLTTGGTDGRFAASGHIVYGRSDNAFGFGALFAAPFDTRRLEITGAARPVAEGIRTSAARTTGAFHFDIAANGTLAYIPGSAIGPEWGRQQIVLADRSGRFQPLPLPAGLYRTLRVSPDGARMAVESGSDSESNIYVYDLHGSTALRRLTFGGRDRFPVWSADGKQVLFQSDRGGDAAIYSQPADGASTAKRLTRPGARDMHAPEAVSPDGAILLFSVQTPTGVSLATLSLRDGRIGRYGDAHSSIPFNARFSPDGRWVAYGMADRSGRQAIFVSSFPSAESKYELPSDASGTPHKPVWAAGGRELLYVPRLGGFEAIAVTTAPSFSFGQPASIPRSFNPGAPSVRALFDVTPQGSYVGVLPVGDSAAIYSSRQVQVVLNWLTEVERLVPRR